MTPTKTPSRKPATKKPVAKTAAAACTEDSRSRCPMANGLDILGDRWTLLVIRDLMFTNRREFSHFLNSGEGISTNILTERLERLQCSGIISKQPHPEHGKKFIYQLTERGLGLAPMMVEFTLWACDNIDGIFMPPEIYQLMKKNRAALLEKIQRRETLLKLEL